MTDLKTYFDNAPWTSALPASIASIPIDVHQCVIRTTTENEVTHIYIGPHNPYSGGWALSLWIKDDELKDYEIETISPLPEG